jgi:hypothetical protein
MLRENFFFHVHHAGVYIVRVHDLGLLDMGEHWVVTHSVGTESTSMHSVDTHVIGVPGVGVLNT